ncbi:outer membrane protein assembly factor BamA [Flammeovirga yaeyamensis]|uniref:Outer membrane protein assembly factor BamA n=1 Tax=Flammeovirga yaeyamensis TaxID=367791 RepID=A0AAX1N832_9BACT|nr:MULTISPECIES: outer membrane protein assembly factor BamA [Flammeovirga]ANQ48882.1 outer membrane protein assembly factor BamA [Flammeovirga sp. MY04]MBB3698965.1 outer membrane protein insertion porin family [Flammeovirga yaeyamensis]NMF36399.1 outer membrane protein assembly factor BamA [Flammeovirga yaeyamensis]QWG03640.1 outer membrane protein assembly factor BamA [Flammeovirga yaeyamensis]
MISSNKTVKTLLMFISIWTIAITSSYAQFGTNYGSQSNKYNVDYGTPVEYTIAGIDVVGADFNDKNALINIAGFKVGEKIKIPGDAISKAVKKLWKLGIVGDVQINITEIQGNDVYLQIALKERPKLSKFYFEGIKKGQAKTLTDKVQLVRGRIVTESMIRNTQNIIKDHYAEKGFKNTEVKIVKEKDPVLANSVVLRIDVQKNSKVKIEEINLAGVEKLTEKKVKRKLKKTKEKRFGRIFTPSKFVAEEYKNDKKSLVQYYNEEGYRDAEILRDSVYDVDPKMVSIDMDIYEGTRYYYRNITWTGNYKYTNEELGKVLGITKGDVYNTTELNKRLSFNPNGQDISALYMDDGYLFFSVTPTEIMVEGDSVDVEMRVFEGEQAYVSKIIVNGNTKTSDHVIYREIRTLPGQKFSRSDLIRTQRELSTLGYFDPETIDIQPKPNMSNGTVDIQYGLTEKANDQIELSGGWGGFYGFVGTVGLVFNNFSLRNVTDFSKWRPLPAGDGQRLQLRVQASGIQYQTYSVSFTEPWLGGRKPNSLTVSYNYSNQNSYSGDVKIGSLGINAATVALGRRLQWPDDWFTMSNSLSFLVYDLNNWYATGFGDYNNGKSYNLTFNTTLSRNSIDQPTYPRRGSQVSLSVSLTPPYSAFGDKDFSDPSISDEERYKWVEYHKWMFDNAWYQSIIGDLVMAVRAHVGFLAAYNQDKGLGPFERFIMGGDGLTQQFALLGTETIGLRGYENNSIVPYESNGLGGVVYNKYVMELRYPVSLNPAATIYLLGFAEGGNNWATIDEFNPFEMYKSAGFGARIFMPAFGMLGIDWAYGFDAAPGRSDPSGSQFHFTIGQQLR